MASPIHWAGFVTDFVSADIAWKSFARGGLGGILKHP